MLPLTFDRMMPSISFQEKYFRKTNDFPVLKKSFKIQGISLNEGEDGNTDTHGKTHRASLEVEWRAYYDLVPNKMEKNNFLKINRKHRILLMGHRTADLVFVHHLIVMKKR